ncbi:TRAP transporter small permease [Chloroflexota bacterium]
MLNIQKAIFSASRVASYIAMVLLVLLVLLTVADVILRRFFDVPIAGTFEVTTLILGTVVFFSLAYCAVHGSHIAVDIVVLRFSKRTRAIVGTIIDLLSVGIMGLISWRLFLHAIRAQEMGETTAIWEISLYPFVYAAALGSLLLTGVLLIQLLHTIAEVRK